jgi:hypothetical protein
MFGGLWQPYKAWCLMGCMARGICTGVLVDNSLRKCCSDPSNKPIQRISDKRVLDFGAGENSQLVTAHIGQMKQRRIFTSLILATD